MKSLLRVSALAMFLLISVTNGFSQNVGISNTTITPDPEAILELRSTDKGVLLPRLTTAQAATLASSLVATDDGMTVYDTDLKRYKYWNGTTLVWNVMATNTSVASNTLDDAYDAGGAGAGSTITADSGPVVISGTGGAGNNALRTDGDVRIGLGSGTNNDLYISNRLIDWDNSTFFVDPGSDSRMNQIEFSNGSIGNPTVWFEGDNNSGLYQPADGIIGVTINGAEAMRVNAGRDAGIGTTSPDARLEVQEAAAGSPFPVKVTKESNTANELIGIGFGAQIGQHYAKSGIVHERESANGTGKLHFLVDDATDGNDVALTEARMTIDRNGLVGVGTQTPLVSMDVRGSMIVGDAFAPTALSDDNKINIMVGVNTLGNENGISFYENANFGMSLGYDGSGSGATNALRVYNNADGHIMTIENGGNVGIGTTTPAHELHVVGTTRISTLSGAGTRMVVADANGDMTTQTIPANGDITGVTAGDGLTGGGTTGAVTLDVVATNGLTDAANDIRLGGTLVQNTTITQGANSMNFNMNGTGDFNVQDNGTTHFRVQDNGHSFFGDDTYWRDGSTGGTNLMILNDDGNDGRLRIYENGVTSVDLDANTQFVFNEQGFNRDFRVESDGNGNMLMVDAGNNRVGIGTGTPGQALDVNGNIHLGSSTGNKQIYTWTATDANWRIGMSASPGFTRAMNTAHVEYMTYAGGTTQGFAVGVNGGNSSFEVRGSDHAAYFRGRLGVNSLPTGNDWQYVHRTTTGANQTNIYARREGVGGAANGGNGYGYTGMDLAIKGYSYWGNNYSAGMGGYSFLDYDRSAGVHGGRYNGTVWGALGYQAVGGGEYGLYYTNFASGTGYAPEGGIRRGIGAGGTGDMLGSWTRGDIMGHISAGEAFASYNLGDEYTSGKQIELVETGNGKKQAYTVTATSSKIYENGIGSISNGTGYVEFSEEIKAMMGPETPTITITPTGMCNGVYLESVTRNGFTVKELANGSSNVSFNWIMVSSRIDSKVETPIVNVLDQNFDQNLLKVMGHENDPNKIGVPMWWDGQKIRFDAPPKEKDAKH